MVNLKAKPYYLNDEDIQWVMDTIASMSDEEKVGQLFVNMVTDFSPEAIKKVADTYHPGALRYHNKPVLQAQPSQLSIFSTKYSSSSYNQ